MNVVSYFNPATLEKDNDGELGLITETITSGTQFYSIYSQAFDIYVNGCHGIKSFSLEIDNGSCTFSKEFRLSGTVARPYWYASKKVNGKLKRLYFGTDFTKDKLNAIVDRLLNQARTIPLTEPVLAGHGKCDEHIQPHLVITTSLDTHCLKAMNNQLERQNKDLNKSLIEALDKIKDLKSDIVQMQRNFKNRDNEIKILEERNKELLEISKGTKPLINSLESSKVDALKRVDILESECIRFEKDVINFRNEATKYHNELEQERWESSRREEQVKGYYFMHEELSDQVFKYRTVIEKYRVFSKDKSRQSHPRFNKLLDFLDDIDKLC